MNNTSLLRIQSMINSFYYSAISSPSFYIDMLSDDSAKVIITYHREREKTAQAFIKQSEYGFNVYYLASLSPVVVSILKRQLQIIGENPIAKYRNECVYFKYFPIDNLCECIK